MFGSSSSRRAAKVAAEVPERSHALSRLFEEHNRTLHSFLLMRLGNEQEAREVAQEAYVRLLQLDRPGTISFLRAYLFKTAANLAVDRIRQQINRAQLDQIVPRAETVDCLGPDHRLMATEELDTFEKALFELPQSHRRAFVLHRFEDWPTAEIARDLGVGERSARNYISRAAVYCKLRIMGLSAAEAKARAAA
jgi:RNA polymerase sigma-70 factor (ECF subfamily)